jgi:hypothetical protein
MLSHNAELPPGITDACLQQGSHSFQIHLFHLAFENQINGPTITLPKRYGVPSDRARYPFIMVLLPTFRIMYHPIPLFRLMILKALWRWPIIYPKFPRTNETLYNSYTTNGDNKTLIESDRFAKIQFYQATFQMSSVSMGVVCQQAWVSCLESFHTDRVVQEPLISRKTCRNKKGLIVVIPSRNIGKRTRPRWFQWRAI